MRNQDARQTAADIFRSVLKEIDPYRLMAGQADRILSTYQNGGFRKLLLISFGKAAYPMARAVSDHAGAILNRGILLTKYGHLQGPPLSDRIASFEAGHPVPDDAGIGATETIIDALRGADEATLVVCLISGGGSALLVAPQADITLDEKQQVTQTLLKAGADIRELNTVRKHLSRIKGGRLAELAHPAPILALILSDVIGDPLDVIASGPTSPDPSTFADALEVLDRYGLAERIPPNVLHILGQGVRGAIPETPKAGHPVFRGVENRIIGSNRQAIEIAKAKAEALGYEVTVLSAELQGEARDAATWLVHRALDAGRRPHRGRLCLITGGETTVVVRGSGLGGRNTELALTFALGIQGREGITLLSAGTDGTDGPTDAAGAIVDGETIARGESRGLSALRYLDNNDSYAFCKETDTLLMTGPTGTNVMDLQIVLLD